jgi:predicted MFS family arabinose efflux permease
MQEDQRWSYEVASWLNTANALGYIIGALTCLVLLRFMNAGQVFRLGLCATAAAVLLTGVWQAWWWLLAMRVVAGCGAAWAFAAGGAVVAAHYREDKARSSLASGIFFSGAGLGMAISAGVAPTLIAANGVASWPYVWIALGTVCVGLSILPYWVSRRIALAAASGPRSEILGRPRLRPYMVATVAYVVFAFAHTAYVFFVFAWSKVVGIPWYLGASMWVLLGLGVLASPFLWQRALKRWDPNRVLAACCLQTCCGAALPLVSTSGAVIFLSALLVGLSFFMAPTAVALLVRASAPEPRWAIGITAFAVVFSVGQAAGSWATGVVADNFSLTHALGMGAAGLLVAASVACFGRVTAQGSAGQAFKARNDTPATAGRAR